MGNASQKDIRRYNDICTRAKALLARLTDSKAAVGSCNAGATLQAAQDGLSIVVSFQKANGSDGSATVSVQNGQIGNGITSITVGEELVGAATALTVNYGTNKTCKFSLDAGDEGRSGSTDSALTFYYKNGGKKFEYTMTGISVSGNVVSSSVSGVNFGATGISISVTGLSMTARLFYLTYDKLDSAVAFNVYTNHLEEVLVQVDDFEVNVNKSEAKGSEQDKKLVENTVAASKVESGSHFYVMGTKLGTQMVLSWVKNP